MKTFPVTMSDGSTKDVEQLATFTRYLENVQYRFVVTRNTNGIGACVTHRGSGLKCCDLAAVYSCHNGISGYLERGRSALEGLIAKRSEHHVRFAIDSRKVKNAAT